MSDYRIFLHGASGDSGTQSKRDFVFGVLHTLYLLKDDPCKSDQQ